MLQRSYSNSVSTADANTLVPDVLLFFFFSYLYKVNGIPEERKVAEALNL